MISVVFFLLICFHSAVGAIKQITKTPLLFKDNCGHILSACSTAAGRQGGRLGGEDTGRLTEAKADRSELNARSS